MYVTTVATYISLTINYSDLNKKFDGVSCTPSFLLLYKEAVN